MVRVAEYLKIIHDEYTIYMVDMYVRQEISDSPRISMTG